MDLAIDTVELTTAEARSRDAAGTLAAVCPERTPQTRSAHRAPGDPVLSDAVEALFDAWAPTHRSLVATLEGLADRLARAAATFESAEVVTAQSLAHAIHGGEAN